MWDMSGRVALVTGATSGVGRETAKGLAAMGASVVLAVRDVARGREVAQAIARDTGGPTPEVLRLDLASLADVRRAAADFRATHDRLHVLVNNAGIHTAQRAVTVDGHESTFQTNHLGHFLFTHELLGVLQASAPARVVTVASEAHRLGWMRWDDLEMARPWSGWLAYAQSKLANILFSFALARRLEGTRVTANAVHPGSVRTGWARGPESGLLRYAAAAASPFLISPEKGARTSLRVAADPALADVTGTYFVHERPRKASRAARDVEAQERLWTISERFVGLAPGEPR